MESEEVVTCCASCPIPSPVLVHSKPALPSSAMLHHARHSSLDLRGHVGPLPGIARAVTPPSSASSNHMPRRPHHQQHQRNLSLDSAMRVLSPAHHSGGDTADRRSLASDDSGIFNSDDGDRTSRVNVEAATGTLAPAPPCQLTLRPPVQGVIDEVHSPVQEASIKVHPFVSD
ncbi:hypothetical protein HPB49_006431 [Dermacentor silvarum]|uniref:Uncharacterized protein n=1 Tax=Dermacentor silvarum TaxID=543639 RepID=A0ACB8C7R2_DERSI|nr:hypothetical protein HPB49_006431 [Dermacentor silvarum]